MPMSSRTASPERELFALAPIARVAELRSIEARHAHEGLMERAGAAAAEQAARMLAQRGGPVIVLAGPGNNGGDAFVVARLLRAAFFDVITVFLAEPRRLPADAANALAAYRAAGGTTTRTLPEGRGALIVDGLFGIGLTRPLSAEYAALVDAVGMRSEPILALDVPSGLDADTGNVHERAIRATATATFIALKPGLLTGDGPDYCGALAIHTLDIALEGMITGHRVDWPAIAAALPDVLRRQTRNVHKGSFGTLAIVGGAPGMVGAAILAGRAAVRMGAGKVHIGFASTDRPAVDWVAPELMLRGAEEALRDDADAVVIGPGLGSGEAARKLVEAAIALPQPLVVDADALNVLARDASLRVNLRSRQAPTWITPHPAEAARLARATTMKISSDRVAAAVALARDLNACVVLKGAGSVLAYPDGMFDINASGGPALASGGTGDVLSGILGALAAQRIEPRSALRIAVCVHGAAADALVARGVGPLGVTASEIADSARSLIAAAASNSSPDQL